MVERRLATPVDGLLSDADEGPTFGFVHVQTDDVEKVKRDAVKVLRLEPDVEVEGGWVRVRSDATDAEPARLKALAKELSYTTGGVVLSLGVERGAVVRYDLFDKGADVDEYLSVPEYYGSLPPGDVNALGANATVLGRLTGADPAAARSCRPRLRSPLDLSRQGADRSLLRPPPWGGRRGRTTRRRARETRRAALRPGLSRRD